MEGLKERYQTEKRKNRRESSFSFSFSSSFSFCFLLFAFFLAHAFTEFYAKKNTHT